MFKYCQASHKLIFTAKQQSQNTAGKLVGKQTLQDTPYT